MSKPKSDRDGQSLSQRECQDLDEQALEGITGGNGPEDKNPQGTRLTFPTIGSSLPFPTIRSSASREKMATVYAWDTSPEAMMVHTATMSTKQPGTVWQHGYEIQPDGTVSHTYKQIKPPTKR